MTGLQFEFATPADLDSINALYAEIGFQPSTAADDILVARSGSDFAALGRLVHLDGGALELGGMYVHPDHRRTGVAREIVRRLLHHSAGAEVVFCLPFARLASFYASCGFVRCEVTSHVPPEIRGKLAWCETAYSEPVILMARRKESY